MRRPRCPRTVRRFAARQAPPLEFHRLRRPTARDYRPGLSRNLVEWQSADGRYLITFRRVIYGVPITPHFSAQVRTIVGGRPCWHFCQGRPHRHRSYETALAACAAHARRN